MRNAKNKLDSEVLTPVKTGDGSTTFYSSVFGEWYHNRQGAFNEAEKTYVESSQLAHRAKAKTINILDICYGLGYNTAAALETVLAVNGQCQVDLKALEIDLAPSRCAIAQNLIQPYAPPVQQVLQDLATHCQSQQGNVSAQILLGDARQQIQPLIAQGWQADIIFLDPFSPPNCPQLWTLEFLQRVAQCLSDDGVLVTYSCAAAVRSALLLAGLKIGSIRWGAKVSRHNCSARSLQRFNSRLKHIKASRYQYAPRNVIHTGHSSRPFATGARTLTNAGRRTLPRSQLVFDSPRNFGTAHGRTSRL
ncbi:MAG: MnmC family methyltransferase [Cyanobacteria bacterium J06597_16]